MGSIGSHIMEFASVFVIGQELIPFDRAPIRTNEIVGLLTEVRFMIVLEGNHVNHGRSCID